MLRCSRSYNLDPFTRLRFELGTIIWFVVNVPCSIDAFGPSLFSDLLDLRRWSSRQASACGPKYWHAQRKLRLPSPRTLIGTTSIPTQPQQSKGWPSGILAMNGPCFVVQPRVIKAKKSIRGSWSPAIFGTARSNHLESMRSIADLQGSPPCWCLILVIISRIIFRAIVTPLYLVFKSGKQMFIFRNNTGTGCNETWPRFGYQRKFQDDLLAR